MIGGTPRSAQLLVLSLGSTANLASPGRDVVQKLQQGILITGTNLCSSSPRTFKGPEFVARDVKNGVIWAVEGRSFATR